MPGRKNTDGKRPGYLDIGLVFSTFVLVVIGLIMIYSTSAYEANIEHSDSFYYLKKQLFAIILGFAALIFTTKFPYRLYKGLGKWALVFAAFSMFLLLTPLAHSANGATRWVYIFGISIQPAEIVKIAVIIYIAGCISTQYKKVLPLKGMLIAAAFPILYAGIIWKGTSNLSSATIILCIVFVMFACSVPYKKRFLLAIVAVVIIAFLYVVAVENQEKTGWNFGYHGDRVLAWRNPEKYADDEGYQTLQSLYAIGSGGMTGKGIGESVQKLGFIPEAQNDMIFAIICEELGLVGAFIVMGLFLLMIYRCFVIAISTRDLFGKLLVIGIMTHVAVQVVFNIAVVTNTIPNTGISLPFISYGGTSIVFLMAEIGVVLNVGRSLEE